MAVLTGPDYDPGRSIDAEIDRVNQIVHPALLQAVEAMAAGEVDRVKAVLRNGFDAVTDGLQIELKGRRHVPTDQSCLLVANHPGFSNAHAMSLTVPGGGQAPYGLPRYLMVGDSICRRQLGRPFNFITRETPPVTPMIEAMDYIPVPAENPDVTVLNRQVCERVEAGGALGICPEGNFYGRVEDDALLNVGPFKRGFYHFARQAKVPVVPVKMVGFNQAGRKEALFEFGHPMEASGHSSAQAFADKIRREIFGGQFGFQLVTERP